jgi:hypothetical protein
MISKEERAGRSNRPVKQNGLVLDGERTVVQHDDVAGLTLSISAINARGPLA